MLEIGSQYDYRFTKDFNFLINPKKLKCKDFPVQNYSDDQA